MYPINSVLANLELCQLFYNFSLYIREDLWPVHMYITIWIHFCAIHVVLYNHLLFVNFRDMMATGCEDKLVRIYYLATITDQPLKIFSGIFLNWRSNISRQWVSIFQQYMYVKSGFKMVNMVNMVSKCIMLIVILFNLLTCTCLGHTAKVFHIKWSPLKEGMLASGSDDR